MNEIIPLIWPSPNGIGQMPVDTWAQTVAVAKAANIIPGDPDAAAYRTDLARRRLRESPATPRATTFVKGTVPVTPGGN